MIPEGPTVARLRLFSSAPFLTVASLRLLFALFLMSLGTWFGALAISGYYRPQTMPSAEPAKSPPSLPPSADKAQFIGPLSRNRFVAVEPSAATAPAKPKPPKGAAKPKPPATDKRPQQASAQLPWPLSLFSN
jgi:hypothetical protein